MHRAPQRNRLCFVVRCNQIKLKGVSKWQKQNKNGEAFECHKVVHFASAFVGSAERRRHCTRNCLCTDVSQSRCEQRARTRIVYAYFIFAVLSRRSLSSSKYKLMRLWHKFSILFLHILVWLRAFSSLLQFQFQLHGMRARTRSGSWFATATASSPMPLQNKQIAHIYLWNNSNIQMRGDSQRMRMSSFARTVAHEGNTRARARPHIYDSHPHPKQITNGPVIIL